MTRANAVAAPSATIDESMPSSLAQAFVNSIRRYADREAVKPLNGPPITYAEMGARVRSAVTAFRHMGLAAGDRIAICLPNGSDWPVLTYAAALLGLCVVPINLRYREDELLLALDGSEARVLFTIASFLSNPILQRLRNLAGGEFARAPHRPIGPLPMLEAIVLMQPGEMPGTVDYADMAAAAPHDDCLLDSLAGERRGSDPMWLFWTSGTTSKPKAALLPQSAIEIVWQWTTLVDYRPEDRVLTSRPFFYIAGHFWSMLGPFLKGACSVIASHFTPEEFVHLCSTERISILSGNPMMFKRLVQSSDFDPDAFTHVRLGYFSGSALPLEEMRRIHDAIGFESLIQTYGMTELGGFIMSTSPQASVEEACASCGRPFTDIDLQIVSPETGEPVPDGNVGMLVTKRQKLIDYVNLSPIEREKLFDEKGWYRTGDLMRRLPDGRYQMVGRVKDLIKVGGENVTSAEIEAALMRHPSISLAAVVARMDEDRGEVPIAYVELTRPGEVRMEDIKIWSKTHMAPFKVPVAFHEMSAADWPMTSSGKIAKHLLATIE